MFNRKSQIQKLCEQTGVHFRYRDGPNYGVIQEGLRQGDFTAITVNQQDDRPWIRFNCNLPIRFPLDRTPDRLFARAMMRSIPLGFARWHMDISESSDASLYLFAAVPKEWMTPALFSVICEELATEVRAFHQEIRDRFNYGGQLGGGVVPAAVRQPFPGLPMVRPDDLPQRYR